MNSPGRQSAASGPVASTATGPTGIPAPRRRGIPRAASDSGQGVVEFALVLPVLAAVVMTFVAFGKALFYYIDLTHVANEGARLAAVNPAAMPNGSSNLTTYLCSQLGSNSELVKGSGSVSRATVVISYPDNPPTAPASSSQDVGEPVKVVVSTQYSWFPFMNLGSFTIAAAATMRLEQNTTGNAALTGGTCS